MKLDILTLEVGSTMTKANGFRRTPQGGLSHVAQGFHPTTVAEGDVAIGVEGAIASLENQSGHDASAAEIFINSSAAGGLKMTVHGLTMSMTARAAKEASLGAGAIVKQVTAGPLFPHDIDELLDIQPNLILLAGGVDYGDTATVLKNAETLLALPMNTPLIYAGNVVLQKPIRKMAQAAGRELWVADNVFPQVDTLNVGPLRRLIHDAFSKHIIHAPGMHKLSRYTTAPVIPTPGAVLLAAQVFASVAGDTLVIDVGGATTDIHSVTDGSEMFARALIDPEPREKRTVEGDLGVFVNAHHVLALDQTGKWKERASLLRAMPQTPDEQALTRWLTETAVMHAVRRHAGTVNELFTAAGRQKMVRGKDLTAVQWIVGTGGALTRIPGGEEILQRIRLGAHQSLFPPPEAQIVLDRNYLLSALGTIAGTHPELVAETLKSTFIPAQGVAQGVTAI